MDPQQNQHQAVELYDRLRALARARMNGRRSHTLDPTGLANEAVLRLPKCDPSQIRGEEHFLALAAEAMRQILVDHARGKAAQKRGGDGMRFESLGEAAHFAAAEVRLRADPAEVLALNEALKELEVEDADAATIVKMRAFAGMSCDEIAALLDVSKRTIERRWRYAMAELRTRLADENRSTGRPAAAIPQSDQDENAAAGQPS